MRALDLYCCGGGASKGLRDAGFTVVGVDHKPQPRYPYEFRLGDVLELPVKFLRDFDLIWASPPCQFASCVTPVEHRGKHRNLIPSTREMLRRSGVPYIIENVASARSHLSYPFMLCGTMFGLRTRRHRYFETSFPFSHRRRCDHSTRPLLVTTAGAHSRAIRKPGEYKSVRNAPLAYGIDWMRAVELKEAIPPAYAEFIARGYLELSS